MTPAELADLSVTCDLPAAADALGISKTMAYKLVADGEFPCRTFRLGARIVVATADLRTLLGVDQTADPAVIDELRRTNELLAELVKISGIQAVAS